MNSFNFFILTLFLCNVSTVKCQDSTSILFDTNYFFHHFSSYQIVKESKKNNLKVYDTIYSCDLDNKGNVIWERKDLSSERGIDYTSNFVRDNEGRVLLEIRYFASNERKETRISTVYQTQYSNDKDANTTEIQTIICNYKKVSDYSDKGNSDELELSRNISLSNSWDCKKDVHEYLIKTESDTKEEFHYVDGQLYCYELKRFNEAGKLSYLSKTCGENLKVQDEKENYEYHTKYITYTKSGIHVVDSSKLGSDASYFHSSIIDTTISKRKKLETIKVECKWLKSHDWNGNFTDGKFVLRSIYWQKSYFKKGRPIKTVFYDKHPSGGSKRQKRETYYYYYSDDFKSPMSSWILFGKWRRID